ncbi:MAG TPA: prepilin-type N-terminal cleavage/methylation domain-containing protein, partial [Burkholderiales bacterium]|nr:prepilin-type N-terminal cleavage/methylation domain-containing protein [Burkholderiales bacterium]
MNARRARGFTILELMMVVAVVAVLAAIALPNLSDVIVRTRLKTA